ncbi:adenosylcobinamide-GDP ribazoletransferase [Roseovarius aestuariivivens]|uniref:adenosylcobinamide-GDP ribazoletransferase n=1 Tax=Roseovarius aestuariivivens TaxID=1888910 RepID=UPI001080DFB9|nr:adenosylcobinamide-GDP ribazoletransferase [Roseovarius aestuariivivens]
MSKNDDALLRAGDLAVALSLLTRLPVPGTVDMARGGRAAWAYPLAGVPVALLAGGAGLFASTIGLASPFCALITLTFSALLTGALHEDGLADTADGLWGGWTRDRRLEIMKDSHIGTYGVIAIFLSLSWRWAALFMLFEMGVALVLPALVAAALLSRAVMPALMAGLPHARDTGLSHSVGRAPWPTAALALALAVVGTLFCLGPQAVLAMALTVMTTACVAVIARRKIGGQTGDILGAAQQIAEIAVLTALIA